MRINLHESPDSRCESSGHLSCADVLDFLFVVRGWGEREEACEEVAGSRLPI